MILKKPAERILRSRWVLLFVFLIALTLLYLPKTIHSVLPTLMEEKTVWELPEDAVCLYPDRSSEISGYKVKENRFVPEDSDPYIGFALQEEALTSLLIDLEKPVDSDIRVAVYYATKDGSISDENKTEAWFLNKETQLVITIPSDCYNDVRININGKVRIKGIYYTNSAFIENRITVPLGTSRIALVYAACSLFFFAILLSIGLVIFNKRDSVRRSPYIIVALVRVWLGSMAGVWYPGGEYYDDAMMLHYSNFSSYFFGSEVGSRDVMLKELGMPIVLNIVNATGISYAIFLSLLWVLAGVLAVLLVRRINHRRQFKLEFLTFVFVLFQPIALEDFTGTRLYRNALLTPMYFLVFLISLIILFDFIHGDSRKIKEALLCSIPLGIVFSLTYLIKEDGIWLLLSICALSMIMICVFIYKVVKGQLTRGNGIRVISAICIPIVMLFISVTAIKQMNYYAFGVYATNARTAGEEGKFVTYVFKTASDDRTLDIWTPADAIDKVFKSSKTLKKNKALRKAVFTTSWQSGSIKENPIKGEFLQWIIKDALFDSGTCTSKKEAEKYMGKVNRELEEAFKNGSLETDHKFRLVSSLSGISNQEFQLLLEQTMIAYKNMLSTGIYVTGASTQSNNAGDTQFASILTNQDINAVESKNAVKYRKYEVAIANTIIDVIFKIYNFIQIPLFILGLISVFIAVCDVVNMIKRRVMELRQFVRSVLLLFFLSLSFVLLFMVSWFCYYLHSEYKTFFFSIGALPLIVLFIIIGCSVLYERMDKRRLLFLIQ